MGENAATTPRPRSFWIGLLVMLLFAGAGIGGAVWAMDRILLERQLDARGIAAPGTIVEKIMTDSDTSPRAEEGTVYELRYRFTAGNDEITGTARVSAEHFFAVREGETIEVRYLPDDPRRNLPAGSHLSRLFWLFAGFGSLIGITAGIVVIGMIVTARRASEQSPSRRVRQRP